MPPSGKVPSWDDPRVGRAADEALLLATGLVPFGGPGAAASRAPAILSELMGLLRNGVPSRMPVAAESMASRSPMLYNPPAKPARPFSADYPAGAPADATGRLTHDIEGRPLVAKHVSGRRVVGGGDEAIPPAEYVAITEGAIGSRPAAVAPRTLSRGTVSAYRLTPGPDRIERDIYFSRALSPQSAERVVAHEMGHMIDELAGQIPTAGLATELRRLYNTMTTGWERTRHLSGPQHQGYRAADVPREQMAEAVRAYLTDPNYIKTVAPRTAAVIREWVNSHPTLSKVIQFNALPLMAGGLSSGEDD